MRFDLRSSIISKDKSLCTLIFLILQLLLFISCQKVEKPQPGGTLYLPGGNPHGFDPARDSEFTSSVFVMDRIYSPVYRGDSYLGNLADSISSDSSGKIWTIYLKKNLHFQDDPCFMGGKGIEITAYDLEFSWMRAKGSPYWVAPVVKQIEKIEVLNSYVLRIILNEPNSMFPHELGREEFFIVSKQAVEYYGDDYRHHPVGSGPFRLAELNPGEVVLAKNDNYWVKDEYGQQLPYLDKIVLHHDPDPVSRYRKLLKEEFDLISIGQINSPTVVRHTIPGKLDQGDKSDFSYTLIDTLEKEGYNLLEGNIVWLLHCPVDRDLRVNKYLCQALNWAIDREKIQSKGLCTTGIPAGGPLIKSLNANIEKYGYDPQKARDLLAEAGYPGGFGLPTLVFSTSPASQPIFQNIKEDLEAFGIKTDIVLESQLQSFAHENAYNIGFTLYTAWDDPMDQLLPYYSKYYLHIDDAVFDSLYTLAVKEHMDKKRENLYKQMEEIVLKEPPAIFLFWFKSFYLTQNYVMNINPDRFGVWEGTWMKK